MLTNGSCGCNFAPYSVLLQMEAWCGLPFCQVAAQCRWQVQQC